MCKGVCVMKTLIIFGPDSTRPFENLVSTLKTDFNSQLFRQPIHFQTRMRPRPDRRVRVRANLPLRGRRAGVGQRRRRPAHLPPRVSRLVRAISPLVPAQGAPRPRQLPAERLRPGHRVDGAGRGVQRLRVHAQSLQFGVGRERGRVKTVSLYAIFIKDIIMEQERIVFDPTGNQ